MAYRKSSALIQQYDKTSAAVRKIKNWRAANNVSFGGRPVGRSTIAPAPKDTLAVVLEVLQRTPRALQVER